MKFGTAKKHGLIDGWNWRHSGNKGEYTITLYAGERRTTYTTADVYAAIPTRALNRLRRPLVSHVPAVEERVEQGEIVDWAKEGF